MNKADEPAFPQKTKVAIQVEYDNSDSMFDDLGVRTEYRDHFLPGLTKREYFAGLALQGLSVACIPGSHNADDPVWNADKAKHAVNLADTLLAELEKKDE